LKDKHIHNKAPKITAKAQVPSRTNTIRIGCLSILEFHLVWTNLIAMRENRRPSKIKAGIQEDSNKGGTVRITQAATWRFDGKGFIRMSIFGIDIPAIVAKATDPHKKITKRTVSMTLLLP